MRAVAVAWMCVAVIGLFSQSALARPNSPSPPAIGEAPVGHRQPTANSVGQPEKSERFDTLSKMKKEDQQLDRKLRNICRGC